MKPIKINKGRWIPFEIRVPATLIILFFLIAVLSYDNELLAISLAIFISFILPAIWFSSKILTIDLIRKKIKNGIYILGFSVNKSKDFDLLKEIHLVENNSEYSVFLVYDDTKTHLITHKNKELVHQKCRTLGEKLDIKYPLKDLNITNS